MKRIFLGIGLALLGAGSLTADGSGAPMPMPDWPGAPPAPMSVATPNPDAPLPDSGAAFLSPTAAQGGLGEDPRLELEALRVELQKMRASNDTLEKRLTDFGESLGLALHGDMDFESLRLFDAAPGQQSLTYWPIVGTIDLDMQARFSQDLTADIVYRMRFLYGGYTGSLNNAGIRSFAVQEQGPWHFRIGTLEARNTPLTLWPATDDTSFEAPQLASRRAEGMDEQLLDQGAWPLQGVSGGGVLPLGGLALDVEAMGSRLGIAGSADTSLNTEVVYAYDQYLFGGRVSLKAAKDSHWDLGASYFEIAESSDGGSIPTAPVLAPVGVQRNQVSGADGSIHFGDVRLEGEFASAIYTPDFGGNDVWTSGNAGRASLRWTPAGQDLEFSGLYVDPDFINYAAQTRVEDTLNNGLPEALTYDNLLNPSTGGYGYSVMPYALMSRFNNTIIATGQGGSLNAAGRQQGGVYLSYDPAYYNSLPYGQATPNREGGAVHYAASLFGGEFKPMALGSLYQEVDPAWYVPVSTGARTYTRGGVGFELGMRSIALPVTFSAGVVYENTQSENFVALTSVRSDAGLDWEFIPGWHAIGSYEQRNWSGSDFYNLGFGSYQWMYADMLVQSYGAVLEYSPTRKRRVGVDFLTTQGQSATATGAFHVEELSVYASQRF